MHGISDEANFYPTWGQYSHTAILHHTSPWHLTFAQLGCALHQCLVAPPICLNKAMQPSGGGKQVGGLVYTHFKHFHVKVSTFYLSTMSPLWYKRRSLWVLVPCSTYSRHSNSKRMKMSRSLWCLQDWVEQAASYTKQFLCNFLADGEQATSQCKTTSAKTKRPP